MTCRERKVSCPCGFPGSNHEHNKPEKHAKDDKKWTKLIINNPLHNDPFEEQIEREREKREGG